MARDIPWGSKTLGPPHHPKPTHPTLPPRAPDHGPAVNTCKGLVREKPEPCECASTGNTSTLKLKLIDSKGKARLCRSAGTDGVRQEKRSVSIRLGGHTRPSSPSPSDTALGSHRPDSCSRFPEDASRKEVASHPALPKQRQHLPARVLPSVAPCRPDPQIDPVFCCGPLSHSVWSSCYLGRKKSS